MRRSYFYHWVFSPTCPLRQRKKSVEETFQKKTPREHILARPDMYIGNVDNEEEEMWVWNSRSSCMQRRVVTWNPAFYKIFDEVLVNAADNKVRDRQQSYIDVVIDPTEGSIEVKNDGEGIPVIKHAEHGLWIPEMIFGHLLTSSNYDDSEKRVTGGRYGYGAKLTNVFSKKFVVETVHRESKQAFQMTWSNNMGECSEASLRALQNHETDYTSVKFWPDFARFKMQELDRSNTDILLRRVIDIAGVTDSTLLVRLNHQPVVVQDFNTYTDLYPGIESDQGLLSFRHQEPRWNVVIRMSDIGYQHVSFVNSIATTRGGTHVKYITDQIISFIQDQALQRRKDASLVAENVRTHLFVFVNAQIDNPSFDSQTKSTLRTPVAQFGSSCTLPKELLQNLSDSGLLERVLASMDAKALKVLNRGIGKGSQLYGIPKLDDAVFAGTEQSTRCTLILTEGDSAKALAVSGLGTIGRDYYGVFALRGKVLNVRASTLRATSNCQEIQYLMQILGLQIGQEYTSTGALRYGRVMIMADQDHDGSHIKGLVVNFLHHFWPSLVKLPGFLTQFITPIVKGHCGSKKMSFFSLIDYHKFRDEINSKSAPLENWTFKYYKGLGTSSSKEGREYFENLEKHTITFSHQNELDDRSIDLAFSPKCVDERKKWITNFEAGQKQGVDHNIKTMTFTEFVQKELIHFSVADCERSIPNVIDGMKPGQRKIMFACFKRNLRVGIKVAQLAGYVSEHTAYHHGETSLHTTIVGLAQDYVGSNNIPLLMPEGQFGTRLQGGKDHASARYIFTRLHPLTRFIYHRDDDPLLDYRDDEGLSVEPEYYVPVLPMALVNGTSGIGTGFATSIPNFNPFEIIENLRLLIANPHAELKELPPWYFGHRGAIEYRGDGRWISRGVCHQITPTHIRITELPVGVWTSAYKKFLEDMALTTIVTSFREQHTENCVHFDMTIHPLVSSQVKSPMHMLRLFRLETTIHTTNMLSYDARGRLKHYRDARDMLRDFFVIRMSLYSKRKQKLVSGLEIREAITKNKLRFLREVLSGSIRLDHKLSTLRDVLKQKGYAPDPAVYRVANSSNVGSRDGDAPQESGGSTLSEPEDLGKQRDPYDYLLSQRFLSLTEERMKDLSIEEANIQQELDFLRKQTTQEMYLNDLSLLETKIKAYYNERAREMKPPSVPIRQAKVFRPRHPELPPMAMRLIRATSRDLTHAESQRSKLAMKQVSDANIENAAEQDETLGPDAALPGGEEKKIGAALSSSNQAQPSKSKKNVKRRRRQGKQ